ncbi:unnamed protein product (macronuclear) [Paramecium tetraurelia]|uniref:EGF-like domain-containing protein n=1 Tax=Paramecium tetraurelia TaxID=5888 RepID=A0E0R8_PARTE|nr:uncharacterized protein GSPATT00022053001 [Paramecium tetraurelia]CAK88885.1 unnamed protein product [Paramecium tetraurelia]|eukprot:XP_001456282.1 hypothetical protein (macronuclear) [Paramecium tetraurelia strain d4-2]
MIFLLIIKITTAWKSESVKENIQTCQIFQNPNQLECELSDLVVFRLDSYYAICLISSEIGIQSLLYENSSGNQYFICILKEQILMYSLPYACGSSFVLLQHQNKFSNYSLTKDDSYMYIFGGLDDSQLVNQLYKYSLGDLINNQVTFSVLPNNFIQKLTVNLELWDGTAEEFQFSSNIPQLQKLKNLGYEYKISSILENSQCSSSNIPKCLQQSVLVYVDECNCIKLFYGRNANNVNQYESWNYYLDEQVWQKTTIDSMIKTASSPIGQYLPEINMVGFFTENAYFFYYDSQWYNNYDQLTFGSTFKQMIVYDKKTFLLNTSSILYSQNDLQNAKSQQYGIYVCQDNYRGYNCQIQDYQCPGSICFNDLLFERICVFCQGHGTCQYGNCKCDDGYGGDDCSQYEKCLNDCSNQGTCIQYYPTPQCRCKQEDKRGGEDCSTIFCLNDCSNNGECKDGVCNCITGVKGDDCSILNLKFIDE